MELIKREFVDKIEVIEDGTVLVRFASVVEEDGKQLSRTFSRKTLCPGADYSNEDQRVIEICKVVHTKDVVDAYTNMLQTKVSL